jgi:hypothetical protein
MEIFVKASTKPGFVLPVEDALFFGGTSAGICYMPDDYESLLAEPYQKTIDRVNQTLGSGHHSVFDHPSYSLLLVGIPKILAMVLNNERVYATSEKSARYTRMEPSPQEKALYEKWSLILKRLIIDEDPNLDGVRAKKLAQENARYMISVFTPTTMQYTVTLRQLNYIINWMMHFGDTHSGGDFFNKLQLHMDDFVAQTQFLFVDGLNDSAKHRSLSLFDDRSSRKEHFGETYCTTYLGSFAQMAQAHRHRTIDYKMRLLDEPSYFVPPIIENDVSLVCDWLKDISSVAEFYPQGMMVSIRERGTYETFILKTQERLCSSAQLEISRQTYSTLCEYIRETETADPDVFQIMNTYRSGARCGSGFRCTSPCNWGVRQRARLI